MNDKQFLRQALTQAQKSLAQGGFPAGAIIVKNGEIVGEGISIGNKQNDPTSHGEMAAIRVACKNLHTSDLSDSVLYASLQPCLMCLGAAMWSGMTKIIFACPKEKVSNEYYGGNYQPSVINTELNRPLDLIHVAEFEAESLKIVHDWEKLFI